MALQGYPYRKTTEQSDGETKSICSHFCLINMSVSDDTIHCTQSEIVLSQNRKTI
jgi:hypothetical protein